jgi:hypothetical protein
MRTASRARASVHPERPEAAEASDRPSNRPPNRSTDQLDPLYVIFEQHLYNFQDSEIDRKTFVANVVKDYLGHLRKLEITIPKPLEGPVVEELSSQVSAMLVKKIYGCLTIGEYQSKVPRADRKKAKTKYVKLQRA